MFNFLLKGPETAPTADALASTATGGAPALTANEVNSFTLLCLYHIAPCTARI